jgi:lysophospholipase L1-like esterase
MKFLLLNITLCFTLASNAQNYKIENPLSQANKGYITIKDVPDGNYRVRVKVGSATQAGHTVIRGESRRLFFDPIETRKGKFQEVYFTINKRNTQINDTLFVKIKEREKNKLNWDNNLTFEFNGKNPQVAEIEVTAIKDKVTTLFLCGNSTVVDQDNEPWCSWGQLIPRFFNENICIANYAESGESGNTFIAARRFQKILTQIKPGDYVFIEFGHNDQKQTGEGKGPYLHFYNSLLEMVTKTREKGGNPVLITPVLRRKFDELGKIVNTHGEYPAAVRTLAKKENVPLIDLTAKTSILYEAMGEENSKKAFVHYPANTFPGQTQALEDNTHFNPYGALQIAKCVIEGMKTLNLSIIKDLRKDVVSYDPAKPDNFDKFVWFPSSFIEVEKPDGN